jgi:hypothetical protein
MQHLRGVARRIGVLSFKSARPESDLEALLARMWQRLYPETIPVLASYWLKTVYAGGHERAWWKALNRLLKQALRQPLPNAACGEALAEIQAWIKQEILLGRKMPAGQPPRSEPLRANMRPDRMAQYIGILLNEWLSAEIAGLLVNEGEPGNSQDGGIPVLAVGNALERLLVRERLSPETLWAFLQPEFLSPRYIYPADAEILVDVVLSLLGHTEAPAPPVMPATLLGVADGASLPRDYRSAVARSVRVQGQGGEEIHVPIEAEQAMEILHDRVRIASTLVTMDGRCWESNNVQSGEQNMVVYKPGARLQIDYSADHARISIPWPATQLSWQGSVHFPDAFELFGREWRVSSWETDGERTSLQLVFSRTLPMDRILPAMETTEYHRSHPASVDMAWAALENALAAAVSQKSREPIEQLRRADFTPLGRALFGLAELARNRRLLNRDSLATQLRAVGYLQAEVSVVYGRVPWRILPAATQAIFLKRRPDPALLDLLTKTFDGLPQSLGGVRSTSPSQAA